MRTKCFMRAVLGEGRDLGIGAVPVPDPGFPFGRFKIRSVREWPFGEQTGMRLVAVQTPATCAGERLGELVLTACYGGGLAQAELGVGLTSGSRPWTRIGSQEGPTTSSGSSSPRRRRPGPAARCRSTSPSAFPRGRTPSASSSSGPGSRGPRTGGTSCTSTGRRRPDGRKRRARRRKSRRSPAWSGASRPIHMSTSGSPSSPTSAPAWSRSR